MDLKLPLYIEKLTKVYDSFPALDQVSFDLKQGEVFGLLGPNGAGKTTLISILTTLEKASSGSAKIFGYDAEKENQFTKPLLGVVPQELISHGFFSVQEVLEFHAGYYGIKNCKDHIQYLLERLGLIPHRDKKVRQLSGGLKRRLLIAKALVHHPRLLLLDEPTAGVDIELRNSLWQFVRELNQKGVSILLTTHYLEEAEELCHRVGILHKGKLLKIDQTENLVKQLTTREIEIVLHKMLPPIQHTYLKEQNDRIIRFQVPHHTDLGKLLDEMHIGYGTIQDIHIREGSLEDAFLNVVWDKHR